MKIEGSIQEIKEFIKEFKSNDTAFTKQQLSQIREEIQKMKIDGETVAKQIAPSISKIFAEKF